MKERQIERKRNNINDVDLVQIPWHLRPCHKFMNEKVKYFRSNYYGGFVWLILVMNGATRQYGSWFKECTGPF
jgi:hypothetical protein